MQVVSLCAPVCSSPRASANRARPFSTAASRGYRATAGRRSARALPRVGDERGSFRYPAYCPEDRPTRVSASRHEAPPTSEMTGGVGRSYGDSHRIAHRLYEATIRSGSLRPRIGVPSAPIASTPLETSTAHGRIRRMASPTFAAVSPPDSTSGRGKCCGSACQSNVCPVPPGNPPDGGASNNSPQASG